MRITEHPILSFDRGKELHFTFNGQPMTGYEGETIAAALHAAGVKVLAKSENLHRPRGFYCAIGNCASCQMVVDGELQVYYAYFKAGTRTLTTYRFTDLYQQHYWTLPIEG